MIYLRSGETTNNYDPSNIDETSNNQDAYSEPSAPPSIELSNYGELANNAIISMESSIYNENNQVSDNNKNNQILAHQTIIEIANEKYDSSEYKNMYSAYHLDPEEESRNRTTRHMDVNNAYFEDLLSKYLYLLLSFNNNKNLLVY